MSSTTTTTVTKRATTQLSGAPKPKAKEEVWKDAHLPSCQDGFERHCNPPTFKLEDVRNAVPKKCWERDAARSMFYMFRDFFMISAVWFAVYQWHDLFSKFFIVTYPVFAFVQGTLFWAVFVVGHDCGHGSFSTSTALNNLCGHITHSFILVPFHSWRISHSHHHAATGNVDKDHSFVAPTESIYREMSDRHKFVRFTSFPLGSWAIYLIMGMHPHWFSHMWPGDGFTKDEKKQVATSLVWWWSMVACLVYVGTTIGFAVVALYYLVPLMVFMGWISIATHLHHTHPDVPWFRGEAWNFLRGALSTVDRSYGTIINHVHHDIQTHVIHHIFTKIPHYHLNEATAHIKPVLGPFYRFDFRSVFNALFLNWRRCRYVADDGDAMFYLGEK
jgi:omega-3 fatty acid desaturase (delta-15 desaturase)